MAFVQGKLHAYQDKRREARHEHERMVQAEREAQRRADQQALHDLQLSALERERRAQEANFAREEESLCRQEKKHDAIQARDGFGHMPSVPAPKPVRRRGDVFGKIADPAMTRPDIDLTFDFGKAAEPTKRDISGTGSAPDISIEHEGASRGGKGR